MKELFGVISATLVILSAVPYLIRTHQNKIEPNITSWSLWTFIGLALLITYEGSGAGYNVLPALFGFISPLLITILAIRRKGKWEKFNRLDKFCLIFGVLALLMWLIMKENQIMVQYALYVAILADAFAAIPTIFFVWKNPSKDRPFAWTLYGIGYGLAIFAIEAHTFANYILPLYMFFGALFIAIPLVIYRYRKRIPIKEWI